MITQTRQPHARPMPSAPQAQRRAPHARPMHAVIVDSVLSGAVYLAQAVAITLVVWIATVAFLLAFGA